MAITMTSQTTNSVVERPSLRDLADARTHYEEQFGWPVTMEVEQRTLVLAVGEVFDALTMPEPLGRRTFTELQLAMWTVPVIGELAGRAWTFLTQPSTAGPELSSTLHRLKVHSVPRSSHLPLPLRTDSEAWIESPRPRQPLPPWSEFIDAVRRANEQFCTRGTAGWTVAASPTTTGGGG
ncbi:hypothetical protein BJ970_005020 [Saccharopolyspora phatthalungensis]|uniref:Uncharacterized protein n=1 Tax=Saccharopolyspora phatthalungensis TaxID=664693 RepID=A0A840QAP6_9PSEU|nr:hypothetical protein [Saccharopolyspora phatthalungensis]